MVDFDESDEMMKTSRIMDKSNTYIRFNGNILFFIKRTKYYH